jgi:predicted ATPase
MHVCDVFESDPAEVVANKLRSRTAELLADADADPDLVAGHLGVIVGIDAGSEASDRDALFSSARQFFEGAAREQPTILVFEDIHWADANMLDLIETLAMRVRGLPLLLVTLSRPELHDTRGGWANGISAYTALTLAPLGEDHARELAVRRLGETGRVDEVIRVAEGNPLFIEQLAATIDETASGTLPTSVRALVAARLDALPRTERALLIDAAVIGKVFWEGALHAMSAGNGQLTHLLEELERRDLVRREATSIIEGERQFAFTHVLIRDVAYDLLPRADRARRHALVAEFFESSTGASGEAIGALARHWRNAGDHERAVTQLVRAAEQAERGWAKDHAAFLYREALELVPADDGDQRSALRRRLAIAGTASFHVTDVRRPESPLA